MKAWKRRRSARRKNKGSYGGYGISKTAGMKGAINEFEDDPERMRDPGTETEGELRERNKRRMREREAGYDRLSGKNRK